jgi:hypothetical protein
MTAGVPSRRPAGAVAAARVVATTAGLLLVVVVPAAVLVATGVAATIVAVAGAVVTAVLATGAAVVVGVEGGVVAHMDGVAELSLVQSEQGACLGESRERVLHRENGGDVGVVRVETAEAVEDEGLVGDGGADVTEGIGEGLDAVAVGGDAEVALHDHVELCLEVDGACHLVVEEEVGDEGPRLPHGLVFRHDDVKDLIGDGPVEP